MCLWLVLQYLGTKYPPEYVNSSGAPIARVLQNYVYQDTHQLSKEELITVNNDEFEDVREF